MFPGLKLAHESYPSVNVIGSGNISISMKARLISIKLRPAQNGYHLEDIVFKINVHNQND